MTSPVTAGNEIGRILAPVAHLVGPQAHLRIVRAGHNLTIENRTRGLLIRVHPSEAPLAWIKREISACGYLQNVGVRVPELADLTLTQPVRLNSGRWCTIWRLIRGRPGALRDYARLGEQVRLLHSAPLPSSGDWSWSPKPRLDRWIDVLEACDPAWLPSGALSELRQRIAECVQRIEVLDTTADLVFCHGDIHPGNLLCADDGDLLVDFEYAGVGPRDWELSEIRCHDRRFGLTDAARCAFAAGYGTDVINRGTVDDEFLTLRELMLATWALHRAVTIGGDRPQAIVRLSSAGDGSSYARWDSL